MSGAVRMFGLLALAGSLLGCGSKCAGTASFYCIVGGCGHDVVDHAICSDGTWVCPSGSVANTSCGGCVGLVPPGCTCGDAGVTCADGAVGQ